MTEAQRFYVNVKPFNFFIEADTILEYTTRNCDIRSLCSRNDYYFDQSYDYSPRGYYRPYEDCNSPTPFADFDMFFNSYRGYSRLMITRNSEEMGKYLIKSNIHTKVCFYNSGCIGIPINERDTQCCLKGWCTCPP